ncbi:MAG: cyclic pyranopterin monophosphate synthase MoaC [Myxococcota bacterium]
MADDPLTHFDEAGQARVVAIDAKAETPRRAVASARVRMAPATLARIQAGEVGKGDVLNVARIAAIQATKTTPHTIPLCHPVRVTAVDVRFEVLPDLPGVGAIVEVAAHDRTGPEMEAMHAASVAALTIYDMCKAMDRAMAIEAVLLLEKSGGKSGHWTRPGE